MFSNTLEILEDLKKGKIILKPENRRFDEIKITEDDEFYIIGKIFV